MNHKMCSAFAMNILFNNKSKDDRKMLKFAFHVTRQYDAIVILS